MTRSWASCAVVSLHGQQRAAEGRANSRSFRKQHKANYTPLSIKSSLKGKSKASVWILGVCPLQGFRRGLWHPVTHLSIPVGHSERHAGGHEQQQRLLLRQLLPQTLDHLGSLGGSLQSNSSRVNMTTVVLKVGFGDPQGSLKGLKGVPKFFSKFLSFS